MKPQEAIETIKIALAEVEWEYPMDYAAAFETAIEALEKTEVKINLNETVKFKLTDYGKDIYYHRFDEINKSIIKYGGLPIEPDMPEVDSEGYTEMQLWCFVELYGKHIKIGCKNVIQPLELIYTMEGQ